MPQAPLSLTAMFLGLCLKAACVQGAVDELAPEAYFDFWLGDWTLSWEHADGSTGRGSNRVFRILDGQVIEEDFQALSGPMAGFSGKSHSVYRARDRSWKQTWVDSQGGYLDFTGRVEGETRIFERKGTNSQGETILQRMRFYDITPDAFAWDWEVSDDEGASWELRWRIHYQRASAQGETTH